MHLLAKPYTDITLLAIRFSSLHTLHPHKHSAQHEDLRVNRYTIRRTKPR
ncbi:uncharacterized protein LACBIDRAFT_296786 [Laccaria bicolor S238N-H82]|uniref:Predicted protein n=1 Tax=Laccaria bicolor (strain S238N-H82 / ATCC MYA-4686) TaxID=486041 RepID=B0E337_LACBS|nr:uncharacterized protein LACBIDRAFT_296786 [Laccaria bicolor S238N-H82]EDQ98738.1 predicted protein [Laccaria bicolor S238N-H82]|eukprot:XP_001890615.1 predicted protein [Laccaria bicolor S238N-H82]